MPGRARSRFPLWVMPIPIVALILAGTGAWLLWRPAPPPATRSLTRPAQIADALPQPVASEPSIIAMAPIPPPTVAPPEPPPAAPDFKIEAAGEQTILDHVPNEAALTVFRFKPNPRILVLDFTSLREQGRMLNRAAAFVEKSGLPHDRLLSDDELDAAVRANGDTVETYYYGHDYGAKSLVRFFAAADRDNIGLGMEEHRLRHLIHQEGWFDPDGHAALISIPQVGADQHVTRAARSIILHHELSHGEYFTNPAYAAFVHHFWTQTLTSAERDRVRAHLRSLGYDSELDDVMENEAQAYMMFTYGQEFFTPDMVGMGKARLTELRGGFFRSMPAGWLRDSLGQYLNANKAASAAHP